MKFLEAVGALSNSTEKTLNPLKAFAICCKVNDDLIEKREFFYFEIDLESSGCFV
jgi:hypothetical protein